MYLSSDLPPLFRASPGGCPWRRVLASWLAERSGAVSSAAGKPTTNDRTSMSVAVESDVTQSFGRRQPAANSA